MGLFCLKTIYIITKTSRLIIRGIVQNLKELKGKVDKCGTLELNKNEKCDGDSSGQDGSRLQKNDDGERDC